MKRWAVPVLAVVLAAASAVGAEAGDAGKAAEPKYACFISMMTYIS
jgi:hypothetical protein